MAAKDYYYAKGIVQGLGRLFFLRVPQVADKGAAPARLLGSIVDEGDGGLFGNDEYPVPESSHILGIALTEACRVLNKSEGELVQEIGLANVTQTLKIDRKLDLNGEANFPGAPRSAGIGVSYKRLRKVTIAFGEGARKRYIPRDLLAEAYRTLAEDSANAPRILFDDDRMVVDQVLLVRKLSVSIESETDFSADFKAKAEKTTKLGLGVSYTRVSDRAWTMQLDGTRDYLFAIGAVEADKFVR